SSAQHVSSHGLRRPQSGARRATCRARLRDAVLGSVVLVAGEPGIGKNELADRLGGEAATRKMRRFSGVVGLRRRSPLMSAGAAWTPLVQSCRFCALLPPGSTG